MSNEIKTDHPFLLWHKAEKAFCIDCSDLRGAGCEPLATVYGWVIVIRNPETGRSMTFENRGECVKDGEGEVIYEIFEGIDGIILKVFND